MRSLNGFRWIVLLIMLSSVVNADFILDNSAVIDTSDVDTVTIDPATGDVYVNTFTQDYTVTSGGTTPPPAGSVAITSFTRSPSVIEENQTTTLAWSSVNATGCIGTATGSVGGWDGSAVARNGNQAVTITTQGSYIFVLRCEGVNGPVQISRSVTVNPVDTTPTPANCETPPLSGVVVLWRDLWRVNFPLPGYDNETLTLPRNGYTALAFETGNLQDHGGIISVANTFTNGQRLGSISACPGDFDVEPECTHLWGSNGGIGWATDGEPGYCRLAANTTYYMNFTFTNGTSPASTTCGLGSNCIATLQHINLN